MANTGSKRVKRSKEEIFLDKGEKIAKFIGAKFGELETLAKRGGYDAAKVAALFNYIDKRSDNAADAFKRGLEGNAQTTGDDFNLLEAAKAVAAETPAT
jgi:hypothetical protein